MPPPPSIEPSSRHAARRRRLLAALSLPAIGAAVLAPLGGATAAVPSPGTPAAGPASAVASASLPAGIDWRPCPHYSSTALKALGIRGGRIIRFRRVMARTECGTLRVPLDYDRPGGRTIVIALTRLPATDPAHRLGILAANPGGPGDSGYLMPARLTMQRSGSAQLNRRYDLIGFDPRGVGASSRVVCPEFANDPASSPGRPTENSARRAYARQVAANRACARRDPAFLSQLTTVNVARDLDRIRAALGEPALSYLGMSWGTGLGATYRTLFPQRVTRMWLDSVMGPDFRLDAYAETIAQAAERDFARQAAWIARRNAIYGLGRTPDAVRAAVLRLEHAYDAHPEQHAHAVIDGKTISNLVAQPRNRWAAAAQALHELTRTPVAADGPATWTSFDVPAATPPRETPDRFDRTMNRATICNEEAGRRDFASAWAAYQRRLARYPVTGRNGESVPTCAGWPFPVRPWRLKAVGGSLELSGHRYESTTPYVWTERMRAVIGGTMLTVGDDVHASAVTVPGCAARIVAYFDTGRTDAGRCAGRPVPRARAAAGR